jgi:acyl-CoA thioester hydrolase
MSRFVHQYRVPWPDVDFAGVVYFVRFVGYFEMAETAWVRTQGIDYGQLLEKLGICMPRVSVHCDYHAPARLDDLVSIEVRLERLGNTSFTLAFELFLEPEREILADGYFVIATTSRESFKPIRVPDELRRMLATLEDEKGDLP